LGGFASNSLALLNLLYCNVSSLQLDDTSANYLDETIENLEKIFQETIQLIYSILGDSAFIPPKEQRDRKTPLKTIYDPIMQVFANNIPHKDSLLRNKAEIKSNLYSKKELLYIKEENNRSLFDGRYNNKKDVEARIGYFHDFLQNYI